MIFQLLFTMLALLFSPFGLMAVMFGFLLFLVGPLFYRATGMGKVFVTAPLWVMGRILKRASFVLSSQNDLLLKRMTPDDATGSETISLGSEKKEFSDPANATHNWLGMKFGLGDLLTGILFDPRFAALGGKKRELMEKGEGKVYATESEYQQEGIAEWVKGVFEMPTKHELINLANVRYLVDGGERAEYPQRVEELYKNSRIPLSSGTPPLKFMYPIVAFVATFGGIWLVMSQLGGSTDQTSSTTVSTLFALSVLPRPRTETIKTVAKGVLTFVLVIAPLVLFSLLLGPIFALALYILFIGGYLALPILALLTRPLGKISGPFAQILLALGLLGYAKPVLYWTPEKYELREYSDLDGQHSTNWYSIGGSILGFSYPPNPDSWGVDVMDNTELENRIMSKNADSSIPAGQAPLNVPKKGGVGGYGPKHVDVEHYYLKSDVALSRFEDSAMGMKSLQRLTYAKEKYGEDGFGINDKTILYATLFMMIIGIALGTWVFIL